MSFIRASSVVGNGALAAKNKKNCYIPAVVQHIHEKVKMADNGGEISNQILDTLAEWNDYLENHVPYYQGPEV